MYMYMCHVYMYMYNKLQLAIAYNAGPLRGGVSPGPGYDKAHRGPRALINVNVVVIHLYARL